MQFIQVRLKTILTFPYLLKNVLNPHIHPFINAAYQGHARKRHW